MGVVQGKTGGSTNLPLPVDGRPLFVTLGPTGGLFWFIPAAPSGGAQRSGANTGAKRLDPRAAEGDRQAVPTDPSFHS
jgi:streptogramin lyase